MLNFNRIAAVLPLLVVAVALCAGCSAESKKKRFIERADRYFENGELTKAEIEYLNVLRLDRTNAHAFKQLGILYFENGRTLRAAPFLIRALELNTNDVEVQLKLATVYLTGGAHKEARRLAENVLASSPTNSSAPLILTESSRTPEEINAARQQLAALSSKGGQTAGYHLATASLLSKEGKLSETEAALRKAIQADPKSPHPHHALGMLLWARTNLVEADSELKQASELAAVRSPQKLQYPDFLLKTGRSEEAKKLMLQIAKEAPDYLPTWALLAELALNEKQHADCAKYVNEILTRDPDFYDGLLLSGRLHLNTGENDKAFTTFERTTNLYPKSTAAHYFMALSALARNDQVLAAKHLDEAVKLNPDFSEALLQQAQLNLRRDNAAAAIASMTQLIRKSPSFAPAYLTLAAAQAARGDLNDAVGTYEQLEKLFPTNATVPFLKGVLYQQQKKTSEARASYEKAFALQPENLQPLELLVNLDLAEKKPEVAAKRINDALEKMPKSPELHSLMAVVYGSQKKTNEVEKSLLKALEFNPNFLPAHRGLAQLYVAANKHPEALDRLNAVVKVSSNDIPALIQIALIQTELKKYSEARDAYERVVAINPRAAAAYNNLAYLYSEQLDQLDRAYEAARKARELVPTDPAVADTLGWIVYKRGEFPRALTLLQESAEKLPTEPDVLFHLGMTQYMLSQEAAARTSLKRALESKADFSGRSEAEKRLAILDVPVSADSLPKLESLAKENPDDPIVVTRLAALYEQGGQFEKAIQLYERAVEKNSRNLAATVRLAQLYSDQAHNFSKALQMAKAARNLAPDDPKIAHTLGRLAHGAGDFNWSLALLQEAQRKLPNDPDVLLDLAISYFAVGKISEAETVAKNAAKSGFARKDQADRLARFASAFQKRQDVGSLEGEIRETLRTAPDSLPPLALNAVLMEQRGHQKDALAAYESILVKYPTFTPALRQLAILYSSTGAENQKTYDFAVKARAAYSGDPEVAKVLGITTYMRKDYGRAAQLLKEASGKLPNDAEVLFYLGMSQHQLKQKNDAQANLKKALAMNLDPDLAKEGQAVLSAK